MESSKRRSIYFISLVFILKYFQILLSIPKWAIPENIHTYTTDGFLDFRRGGGVDDYGILRAWGVFTIGNPKAWGGGISQMGFLK